MDRINKSDGQKSAGRGFAGRNEEEQHDNHPSNRQEKHGKGTAQHLGSHAPNERKGNSDGSQTDRQHLTGTGRKGGQRSSGGYSGL